MTRVLLYLKKYMSYNVVKNIFVCFIVLLLFGININNIDNELTPKWWKEATLQDIKKRFACNKCFDRVDSEGNSLLMMSVMYSNNPEIPMFFVKNEADIHKKNVYGYTARDYAVKRKSMQKFVIFLNEFENNMKKQSSKRISSSNRHNEPLRQHKHNVVIKTRRK